MRVLSINVGQPRQIEWRGESIMTSIFKSPVAGPVRVGAVNLEGDRQSDLTVHGGPRKSVYVYPTEHYAFWKQQLPLADLGFGAFGENLTVEGVTELDVRIGDRLEIGSAVFAVTQPRQPCYKLQVRFERIDMVRRFYKSRRSGFYLQVLQQGEIHTGDAIRLVTSGEPAPTIAEVVAQRERS